MSNFKRRITIWFRDEQHRPLVLLTVTFLALIIVALLEFTLQQSWMSWFKNLLQKSSFFGDILFPSKPPQWKDKLTALIPIIGLPVAFCLWHWRDSNVRAQIDEQRNQVKNQRLELEIQKTQVENQGRQVENQGKEIEISKGQLANQREQLENQRKEVFLKEFQEVQKQAAGLFDIDGSEDAKTQLQIASLYQLTSFLSSSYPETFRRAAFELLLAGHADAVRRLDLDRTAPSGEFYTITGNASQGLSNVDRERMSVIGFNIELIMEAKFPMRGRSLDFIDRYSSPFPDGSDLNFCSLYCAKLSNAKLKQAKLIAADIRFCQLNYADLSGAIISTSKFEHANFRRAKVDAAQMNIDTPEKLASVEGMTFNAKTRFGRDWSSLSAKDHDQIRERWIDLGAVYSPGK